MNKINFWRVERQFTQVDLAQAARLPRYKIQQLELGIALPTDDELASISVALGVPISKLIHIKKEAKNAAN